MRHKQCTSEGDPAEVERTLMAKASPAGLMHYHDPNLLPYRHVRFMNENVLALLRGETASNRLLLTAPPRHTKSLYMSRYLPAWGIGTQPRSGVILASYEATFAEQWGGQARDVLNDCGEEVFGVRPRFGVKAPRSGWQAEQIQPDGTWKPMPGIMWACGASGPITGKGAHLLLIDDPVKNSEDAMSAAKQDKIWHWYRTTFFTRKNPGNWAMILIMTRWVEDDLAGRIMENEGDKWLRIDLPALAEDDDPMGRATGEPLCPEMWSREALEDTRETLGPHWFSALYQQRPQARESAMFSRSRFRYFRDREQYFELLGGPDGRRRRILREDCMVFQAIDVAQGLRTRNDWTVVATCAITPSRELLILDIFRQRIEPAEQWPAVCRMRESVPDLTFQAVESARAGIGLIQLSIAEGHPLKPLKADKDKVTRATPLSVAYEAGKVYHLADASWLEPFELELVGFPVSKHDDQVDAVAYAWLLLQESPAGAEVLDVHPDGSTVATGFELEGSESDSRASRPVHNLEAVETEFEPEVTRVRRWWE